MIPPLTKRNKNNVPYTRTSEVEARIKELVALPPDLIVEQVAVADADSPKYVPSEAIVHLLRWKRVPEKHPGFKAIWETLMARVLTLIGCTTDPEAPLSQRDDIVRNYVFDRLVDLLVSDRHSSNESLDFYEVRFGCAIKTLKIDGERQFSRQTEKNAPLEIDPCSGEISAEVEKNADSFESTIFNKLDDPVYRNRLDAAIDLLEPMQQQIIHLWSLDYPFDSEDPSVATISKTLKKSDKTVRTHFKLALFRLRELLTEE